jgi:hypothetical protein
VVRLRLLLPLLVVLPVVRRLLLLLLQLAALPVARPLLRSLKLP